MKLIKDTKKEPVAMFIRFQPKSYSGGRLCAMLMAEALSALGFEMHIFCNIAPEMESDFKDYSHHNQIQWHINRDMSFNFSKLRFKWIIVVPNLVTGWNEYGVYLQAARLSFRSSAKVIFINFESVSFFNQFSRFKRDPKKWQLWNRFVKYTDIIMSISRIGNSYAVNDYKSLFSKPEFDYCYPAINSLVAKKIMPSPPKKQVIIFCRWIDPHKNSYNVMKIFSDDLNGYNVVIVSGTGGIPKAFSDSLEKKARAFNMQLKLEEQVNEFEKFKMIAESRAMIYLSEFEGFGLPPIEAQYCGVPCVCFDLPVLREVSGDGLIYAECGNYDDVKEKLKEALAMDDQKRALLKGNIAQLAEFDEYCHRLKKLLEGKNDSRKTVFETVSKWGAYFVEKTIYKIRRPPHIEDDSSIVFLENYLIARWENLFFKYGKKRILVYGTIDYCAWLYEVTRDSNQLNAEAVVEGNQNDELLLWGKKIVSTETYNAGDVGAVILASECFQKEYAERCRELFGHHVEMINLYPGMPPGPYRKTMD